MSFSNDIERALLEAVEIEKGNIPLTERKGMPAPTFYVANDDAALIDHLVEIRKKENISQSELAKMIGSKQQAISRTENKEHSPSLKLFYSMVSALGYDLKLVKNANRSI